MLAEHINELIVTLPGDLPRQVMNELRRGWQMEQVKALLSQKEIAAAQPERTWMNGAGQIQMSLDPRVFHYWGQRLGYDCWKDKQFRAEFVRDNPEVRVRSVPRKTCLRIDGFRATDKLEIEGSNPSPATSLGAVAGISRTRTKDEEEG